MTVKLYFIFNNKLRVEYKNCNNLYTHTHNVRVSIGAEKTPLFYYVGGRKRYISKIALPHRRSYCNSNSTAADYIQSS